MKDSWSALNICIDCAMVIANNDETTPEHKKLFDEAVTREENRPIVVAGENTHFSWSPCDFCHSPLGGDRIEAHMLDN